MGDYVGMEFRRILVGAFPSGELVERIQAVRLQHDAKMAHTLHCALTPVSPRHT
jgi:hypothetical protein